MDPLWGLGSWLSLRGLGLRVLDSGLRVQSLGSRV